MNVDEILGRLRDQNVDYLLIGGMNFLLRHFPELTFDVDIWVRDTPENLARLNQALRCLGGAWGPTEKEWAAIPADWRWLEGQTVFCLTTDHGALDVFRDVYGLEGCYDECRAAASQIQTASGVPFASLSDEHMLACQEALPEGERKQRRMEILREKIRRRGSGLP
jgi:hypothetical protein